MRHRGFTTHDLLTAMAIVNIFETGKPFGDHAACAVLEDGAGISYGINQFTHRSGSLLAVVEKYLAGESSVGRNVLEHVLPRLRRNEPAVISETAADSRLKKALRSAAVTTEMRQAQLSVALERYLHPAIEFCTASSFVLPLSLAVVYDGIVHGSFERFQVRVDRTVSRDLEKAWIIKYVRDRDHWLASVPRLRKTRYRTRFFLRQIMIGGWELELPLIVNGFRIEDRHIRKLTEYADTALAVGPDISSHQTTTPNEDPQTPASVPSNEPQAQPPYSGGNATVTERAQTQLIEAAEKFDRADRMITAVTTRTDRAKSLWTTVVGTLWQMVWAVAGFLAGVPREIWFVVAIIAALLMLFYLYRQIALGKIRETK